ncbi:MAG: hypothetical protein ACE5NJ_08775 [Thermodesulfobacteriota bacterium]
MNPIKHRGLWWYYPGYLESPRGPWGSYETYGDQPVRGWKRAIDWMADNGITFIITGIPPYCKDRVIHDWGYHYVLDFDKYPEARVFSSDFVANNRRKLQDIFAYAQKKGVRTYIHHYNFIAPEGFVMAHLELWEKLKQRHDYRPDRPYYADRLGFLLVHLCWHESVYKDFMISCWEEFARRFPEVTGILVTPGEFSNCTCDWCRQNRPSAIADFVEAFVQVMRTCGKDPLVRTWWSDKYSDMLPRDVTYVVKYSVFDCIGGAGPDPLVKKWLGAGNRVWISKEITGSENGGPIVWANPCYFHEVMNTIRRLQKVDGVVGVLSPDLGAYPLVSWGQFINLVSFVHYANHDEPYDEERWEALFWEYFGSAGGKVFQAAKAISELVLGISKVIFEPKEGYTWGFFYWFKAEGRWPGSIRANTDVPEWVRGDMATFREYLDYLDENPWDDQVVERVSRGRKNPFEFLAEITDSARRGWDLLESCREEIPNNRQEAFNVLLQSARMAYYTGSEWQHRLRARLYCAGASSTKDPEIRRRLAGRCLDELRDAIESLREQLGAALDLPHGFMDFNARLGLHWETFFPHSVSRRLKLMAEEYEEVEGEFREILSGRSC